MLASTKVKLAVVALVPLLIGATSLDGDGNDKYTRLTLQGVGYSTQSSEFVSLSASTQTFATDVSRAMKDNASDMDRLRAKLADLNVAKADFRTAHFRLEEGRDPMDDDGDRARGFSVQHQLTVMVRDTDNVGKVIDAMVAAGAKNVQVGNYWGYSGDDVSPAKLKLARADAIKDAQTKANDYATALGMKVHRVVSISDQGGYARHQPAPAARLDVAAGTTIDTRPATVLASVGMVFELER